VGNVELLAYPPGFAGLPHNGFELLSTPPAPHGWRLQKALDKVLATAAIEVVTDEVTGFDTDGDEVRTACGTGGATWPGAAFVLATGRFIGGGLVKSRLVREPLLDLAVYYQGEPVESAYAVLSHLEYVDPAPAFRTGLLTDKELHPVGVDGRPAFRNLFAAGSILGGYDYAGGGCGFGLPLLTGRLAGRFAAG
jgi:glycerol-3-phosphate dehydrogenase subunit B